MFGLQRSGTNYLHWVVHNNTSAAVATDGGWKHAFPGERRIGNHGRRQTPVPVVALCRRRGISPVVVRKDYGHWRDSILRDPKDYDRGDHHPVWVAFHRQWSQFAPVVRYEDFLEDFDTAVTRLAARLEVEVTGYRQPERVANSPGWKPSDRGRYL